MKTTIKDIAESTGLSITTVSRVLNGKAEQYRISITTQENIKETAKKLNYVPNQFAANLKSGKSKTIALILPVLSNPFFASIASEINLLMYKHGYMTILTDCDENIDIENATLNKIQSYNIEGLLIAPSGDKYEKILYLHDTGLPVVCIDRYFEGLDIPYVATDNYAGAYSATEELIKKGHKNIVCIQGNKESSPNRQRVKGFQDALMKANITQATVQGDAFSMENGYIETMLILKGKNIPTAIFTLSNTIALGCMKALKEENIKIPEDISLITYDNSLYFDFLKTPLSSIEQPLSEISKIAVRILMAKINGEELHSTQIFLNPEIIIRDSVKSL
ncbi:MAG: LacI family transcriptional regulator [Bacteroidales bacterium]|nr:LacI family transcriptional regulator [Bacteroidales bacterium]